MSEYQRYEFMTVDRPLTKAELNAVDNLSSHIEASSTHAVIEYHWGDFKHDPIKVLLKYFDGFLYWANWGSPQFALRFPHGTLPENLITDYIANYDFDGCLTFSQHSQYDILEINFGEMEGPDEWTDYDLASLIPIRDELMNGDLRALYIAWLAVQQRFGPEEGDDDDFDRGATPPIPPGFGSLTQAQHALAELLQVTAELLIATGRHSSAVTPATKDDFASWLALLPEARRIDYLLRLTRNEPGLSRLLIKELRELGRGEKQATTETGERVTYTQLYNESIAIGEQQERERQAREQRALQEQRERERQAREENLQYMHEHQDTFWRSVEMAAQRKTSAGYDQATRTLVDLRDAAQRAQQSQQFQEHFSSWVQPHLSRPALVKRLQDRGFRW